MSAIMDNVVKEICESMLNSPSRWKINTHTVDDRYTGVRYWIPIEGVYAAITEVYNGCSLDEVFTNDQGRLVYLAFLNMKQHNASVAQNKVINSFSTKDGASIKWWEFWK